MRVRMIPLTDEVRDCLAQVGEALDDALLLVDQDGAVHFANRAARALLDFTGDRLVPGPTGQWQNEVLQLLHRLPVEGTATEVHVVGPAPLVLEGFAVEEAGAVWGGMFVVRSAAVRQAEMQSGRPGELVHEVKNALHSLLLNVYMLRKWAASQAYVETSTLAKFDVVSNEIHRLNALAEDFGPDARPRIRREAVLLSQLLADVVAGVSGVARENGIEIRTRLPVDLPPLQGDARLLKEGLRALLESRINALGPGDQLEVQAGAGDKHAFVVVTDGGGSSPAGREPAAGGVFEARAGRGSRGLGLTEWVVTGHGGSLETFTAAGVGTTFLVKLPLWGPGATISQFAQSV